MTMESDATPVTAERLIENLVSFSRSLRAAGVPIGTGQVVDAVQAASLVDVRCRKDFATALAACLLRDPAHAVVFENAFERFFVLASARSRASEAEDDTLSPAPRPADRRLGDLYDDAESAADTAKTAKEPKLGGYSAVERLKRKDFEQMSREEFAQARQLIAESVLPAERVRSRRFVADNRGSRIDLRRSLGRLVRSDGELVTLLRRRRREQAPALVLLCDVSGSMASYSRMFLLFAHALQRSSRRVHSFAFGTQLTNVTRHLARADADDALATVAQAAPDRDGGTRIAASLREFNRGWARRVTAQNASVVLLTDGLERDTGVDLDAEISRLRRSCRRLYWLNPMMRYASFEPRAFGMRTLLPYVDRLLPGHNLQGLGDLINLLSAADLPGPTTVGSAA